VRWGSKPSEETGLSEERKALAERYTIDADEAQERELLAGQPATPPAPGPSPVPAQETTRGPLERAAAYEGRAAEKPPIAQKRSSLAEQLLTRVRRRHGDRAGGAAAFLDTQHADRGERAPDLADTDHRLYCARCAREGSADDEGWTLQLRDDDQLQTLCPDCAEGASGRIHVDREGLAVSPQEAADLLGVSRDFFDEYLAPELHVVHGGRRIPISVRKPD
jgi:hypothetical protein